MRIQFGSGSTTGAGGQSAGGKGCLTVFFLIFLVMGSLFAILIVGEAVQETLVWFWPETPCTILSSGVAETDTESEPYRPEILFEYEVDARVYQSRRLTRSEAAGLSYDKARRPSDRYPPGSRATCRVNPENPATAVLERQFPWVGLVVFFPLIFVVIGGGGIFFTWKGMPGGKREVGEVKSISQRARGAAGLGKKIELVVGLIFAVVGGGLSVFLLLIPSVRLLSALDWVEVPATVEASTVRSWSTDDGMSHEADVLYRYPAGDREWLSNRRSFFPMSSGGYLAAQAIVDRHPPGTEITCYVDPDDASRSVLDRGFRKVYLIGLFPLAFLLAGIGLTIHATRRIPETRSGETGIDDLHEPAAERVLEPEAGPIAKIVGITLAAAIWNGIVSIFVWQAVQAARSGGPDWILTIFLIPFVLVGLALIVGIFYTILAAINPRPSLTISPAAPRLGTRLRVNWSFKGKVSRIQHLRIVLEGHEKATYRRGTDTHTDREAFASIDLMDSSAEWEIGRGSAELGIPEDTMHSFSSANNGVVWSLIVHGDIPNWPDVSESFDIEIRPLARDRLLP